MINLPVLQAAVEGQASPLANHATRESNHFYFTGIARQPYAPPAISLQANGRTTRGPIHIDIQLIEALGFDGERAPVVVYIEPRVRLGCEDLAAVLDQVTVLFENIIRRHLVRLAANASVL